MSSTVLGLDLGTNSLGWALIQNAENGKFEKIIDCGVRIFETGMEGDIGSGNSIPANRNRREKRLSRRQTKRHRLRMKCLKHFLQKNEFFPEGNDIEEIIQNIDRCLLKKYESSGLHDLPELALLPHTLPYYIRKRGLDNQLSMFEFGRAVYHLAHRRGFESIRKNIIKDNNDKGVVDTGISELSESMNKAKARTLGEYFTYINPHKDRIRQRWTSRQMYVDEFEKVCLRQSAIISHEQIKQLRKIIFYQRPLKSARNLVGNCQFELNAKRCPWYRIEAQDFRIYQTVNNIKIISENGARSLDEKEREKLAVALKGESGQLDKTGHLSISKAKKILGIPVNEKFSVENLAGVKLKGDRIRARLATLFDERWKSFSYSEKEEILFDLNSFVKNPPLIKRAVNRWGLTKEQAEEFAVITVEEGYCNLSLKALKKILPKMKNGRYYSSIVKDIYNNIQENESDKEYLPLVNEFLKDLKNPVVNRCLSETKRVVNAIIKKHGKPGFIHVELARDLKNTNKQKKSYIKSMNENQKLREEAKKLIFDEIKVDNPSKDDVLKVMLWKECGGICPYTQKAIGINDLLGASSQYDIEHIIPFSRSLDNSFANKTLCYHKENRDVKKNQTPYETYSSDNEKYVRILNIVEKFTGKYAEEKLRRFKMKDITEFEDFSSRQLNDTRYASREAIKYLGLLYGGVVDSNSRKRVFAVKGGITAIFRIIMGLNHILGGGKKSREDHRHHTVDALAIAMINSAKINELTNFIKNKEKENLFIRLKEFDELKPNSIFFDSVKNRILSVITSHQHSNKVRGEIHKETLYGKKKDNKKISIIRRPLYKLSVPEIKSIADPVIKKLVIDKLSELRANTPSKVFKNPENLPVYKRKDGTLENVIKTVRLHKNLNTSEIGKNKTLRNVELGNNHHMEIIADVDVNGKEGKWSGITVTLLEAMERLKNKELVINKESGDHKLYKFSLSKGDIIELDDKRFGRSLFVVNKIDRVSRRIWAYLCNDARPDKIRYKVGKCIEPLRKLNLEKKTVTPLGEVRRNNV